MGLESTSENDPFIGWNLGPCEVLCSLSAGAGTLLAQRDGESLVVLKKLDADAPAIPDLLAHAERLARLNHAHLAQVLPCLSSEDGTFWQSEYTGGASLEEIRAACKKAGKSLPLGLSFATVYEAALALGELHEHHLAHGEVREWNVLVTFSGTTKVLNPGVDDCLQRLAPDPRADTLALAGVLYECLTGVVAHGPTFAPPSTFNHALEKPVDDLLARALGADRGKRFKTGAELAHALKTAAGAYMWKVSQRADFVSSTFKARRQREAVLLLSARGRIETLKRARKAAAEAAEAVKLANELEAAIAGVPDSTPRAKEDGPLIPPPMPKSKKVQRLQGRAMVFGAAAAGVIVCFGLAGLVSGSHHEPFVAPPITLSVVPAAAVAEASAPAKMLDVVEEVAAVAEDVAPPVAEAVAKPKVKKKKAETAQLPPWLQRNGRR